MKGLLKYFKGCTSHLLNAGEKSLPTLFEKSSGLPLTHVKKAGGDWNLEEDHEGTILPRLL